MKLLHIDSSIRGDASVSRRLTAGVVERLKAVHPDLTVVHRDLAAEPLPHINAAFAEAVLGGGESAPHDVAAIDQFLGSDIVVVGAPMYNFAVSSHLKAWIDRLLVRGKTFAYTETGPKRLAGGRRMIVASSRGGVYTAGPMVAADHQETYLRAIFGFIGISDIEFVRAEGLAMGPEKHADSVAVAEREIAGLAA